MLEEMKMEEFEIELEELEEVAGGGTKVKLRIGQKIKAKKSKSGSHRAYKARIQRIFATVSGKVESLEIKWLEGSYEGDVNVIPVNCVTSWDA